MIDVRVDTVQSGDNLREMREERGISQKQMATETGMDKKTIWKYETGKVSIMRLETLLRFSEFYKVSVNELVAYEVIRDERGRIS